MTSQWGVTLKLRAVPSFLLKTPSLLHLANPEEADARLLIYSPTSTHTRNHFANWLGRGPGWQASRSMGSHGGSRNKARGNYSIGNCDTYFCLLRRQLLVDTAPPPTSPFHCSCLATERQAHGVRMAHHTACQPLACVHACACVRACVRVRGSSPSQIPNGLQGCPCLSPRAGSAAPHVFGVVMMPGDSKPDNGIGRRPAPGVLKLTLT
jgi:hypothetical protein